ncbi:hypothetical protein ACQJBY_055515 [Aegilops geniculata]
MEASPQPLPLEQEEGILFCFGSPPDLQHGVLTRRGTRWSGMGTSSRRGSGPVKLRSKDDKVSSNLTLCNCDRVVLILCIRAEKCYMCPLCSLAVACSLSLSSSWICFVAPYGGSL